MHNMAAKAYIEVIASVSQAAPPVDILYLAIAVEGVAAAVIGHDSEKEEITQCRKGQRSSSCVEAMRQR